MQAIGHSLAQASLQLRCALEGFALGPVAGNPEVTKAYADIMGLRDELLHLADAFAELGAAARAHAA